MSLITLTHPSGRTRTVAPSAVKAFKAQGWSVKAGADAPDSDDGEDVPDPDDLETSDDTPPTKNRNRRSK